jgi:hypothetical protein
MTETVFPVGVEMDVPYPNSDPTPSTKRPKS